LPTEKLKQLSIKQSYSNYERYSLAYSQGEAAHVTDRLA
jgi:hypothetical protein